MKTFKITSNFDSNIIIGMLREQNIGKIEEGEAKNSELDIISKKVTDPTFSPQRKDDTMSDLEKRYIDCLNTIFSWAVFRKKDA